MGKTRSSEPGSRCAISALVPSGTNQSTTQGYDRTFCGEKFVAKKQTHGRLTEGEIDIVVYHLTEMDSSGLKLFVQFLPGGAGGKDLSSVGAPRHVLAG